MGIRLPAEDGISLTAQTGFLSSQHFFLVLRGRQLAGQCYDSFSILKILSMIEHEMKYCSIIAPVVGVGMQNFAVLCVDSAVL